MSNPFLLVTTDDSQRKLIRKKRIILARAFIVRGNRGYGKLDGDAGYGMLGQKACVQDVLFIHVEIA